MQQALNIYRGVLLADFEEAQSICRDNGGNQLPITAGEFL
jgi:hypothetical protein